MYKPELKAELAAAFVTRNTEIMPRQVDFNNKVTRSGKCFADNAGEST